MKLLDLLSDKRTARRVAMIIFTCVNGLVLHTAAQSLVPELQFTNVQLKTGPGCAAAGANGAVYIFPNVGFGIDALVSVNGRSSADVQLKAADAPQGDAWQPVIGFRNGEAPAHSRWWMEFSIAFVAHDDHSRAVDVNQFLVQAVNMGGDGSFLREVQTYFRPFGKTGTSRNMPVAYYLEPESRAAGLSSGAVRRIVSPVGSGAGGVVGTVYRRTNRMIVRVGAATGAGKSVAADRSFVFSFKSMYFDVPEVKPAPKFLLATLR